MELINEFDDKMVKKKEEIDNKEEKIHVSGQWDTTLNNDDPIEKIRSLWCN